MRYILNNEGYIYDVSFGAEIECSLGTCTEYKGKVPDGYETIEEWFTNEIERLNAWKIVDGNLVFDANRDYKLKILFDQQNNENSHVTRKEMGMSSTEEINPYTDLFPSHETSGGYIVSVDEKFNRVGNLPTEEVSLSVVKEQDLDLIELEFIGSNFLPNTAISSTNNGIEYTQNKDKTINVSGTATNKSTLNLAGTDTSVRNVLTFKADEDYLLFGLEGLSLEFYHYDGSDRTLVGIYKDGVISFEEDTNITQVVLVVDKGTSINTTIKPMLKLVGLEYPVMPMTKYKGNLVDLSNITTLYSNGVTLTNNGDGTVTLNGTSTSTNTIYFNFTNGIPIAIGEIYSIGIKNANENINFTLRESNLSSNIIVSTGYSSNQSLNKICNYSGKAFSFISVKAGAKLDNVTIFPMIVKDSTLGEYRAYNGRDGQYYVDGVSTQIKSSGKNLLKHYYAKGFSTKTNGITFTINDDYSVTINGTATANAFLNLNMAEGYYTPISEGKTYTAYVGVAEAGLTIALRTLDSTSLIYATNTKQKSYTSTYTGNTSMYLRIASGYTYNNLTVYPMLVEGTEITSYEPYGISPSPDYPSEIINIYKTGTYNAIAGNKIYTFTLPEDLRGVPNGIGDRLWIDVNGDNGIDIERKVGNVVLNGSESGWALSSSNPTFYTSSLKNLVNKPTNNNTILVMSDYFKGETANHCVDSNYNYCLGFNTSGSLWFRYNELSTIDELKTWLSTHNTKVQYELATYTTSYIPSYNYDEYEYEEYKNNTTLIDLAGNELTIPDEISIKDNQIILMKENGTEVYLGDTVMPRTYTPYTHAYCHQKVFIGFKYKDPRNVDITKINLKGLISITDVETEYNFCDEDLTRIQNYIMETGTLTDEEFELYDVNGDGRISASDYVLIRNMINGVSSNKITGTFEINTTQSKRVLVLRDSEGKILTSLGLNGIFTPSLSVNGGKVYGEHVLFSGETNGNVALSDDVRNYDYIEIYYKNNGKSCDSTKIYQANDKAVKLTMEYIYTSGNFVYTENLFKSIYIKNNNIEIEGYGYLQTLDKEINNVNTTDNYIYITRVVGYKGNKSEVVEEDEPDTPVTPEEPTEDVVEVNKTSTITGSTSDNARWTFKTEATEVSIDKVNKTSIVTVTNYIGRPSTNTSSHFMGDLTINYSCGSQSESETVYKNSGTINSGGWYKLGSRTFTIEHTEEPMIINVSGSMSTSEFNPSSASASGSIILTEI